MPARIGRSRPARAYRYIRPPVVGAAVPVVLGVPLLPTIIPNTYWFGVQIAPAADTTADPATWTFFDISGDLHQPAGGVMITKGRHDEQSDTAPAQCTFVLQNPLGDYTPRRRSSVYFPYMMVGLPVRAFVHNSLSFTDRFSGQITEIKPGWDTSGSWSFVTVTAFGAFERLSRGDTPAQSPMYTAITAGDPYAYWPMEDAAGSTTAASAVVGVAPIRLTGTVAYGGATGPAGSSNLPDFSSGPAAAFVLPPVASSLSWRVEFTVKVPTGSALSDNPSIVEFTGTGATTLWQVYAGPAGFGLSLIRTTSAGTTGYNTSGAAGPLNDGVSHHVRLEALDDGVSSYSFVVYLDGEPVMSDTGLAGALGMPGKVKINAGPISGARTPSTEFATAGHLAFYAPFTGTSDTYQAFLAYVSEDPFTRLTRVCAEIGVPFDSDGGSDKPMGPQPVATPYTVIRECEKADGGVLVDGINFGLFLYTLVGRYNPTVGVALALGQIEPPFEPVENNLLVKNDVTVGRSGGSSARYTLPAGQRYSPSGVGGVGLYSTTVTLNLQDDTSLANRAQWLVRVGTVDADRYTQLRLNYAARPALASAGFDMVIGRRLQAGSTYTTGGLPVDVLAEGLAEQLNTFVWTQVFNTSPVDPYFVGFLDDATYGWLDTGYTTLSAPWDGVSTGAVVQVTTSFGPLLSTSGADYPVDMNVDGQRFTATSCAGASNPQTLTVSVASVNGQSASHLAGASVAPWFPFVLSI